ncbi:hypothetical protein HU200_042756 [Digitaria exilis]|uniref:Uncharacterized protein n=1 Tax=Digitaria exilis TaxID=1010633 RepID=A0A835B5U6_9POAL|nr:hypothetical protein HU200_042756 [Digitaria exilis]
MTMTANVYASMKITTTLVASVTFSNAGAKAYAPLRLLLLLVLRPGNDSMIPTSTMIPYRTLCNNNLIYNNVLRVVPNGSLFML